MSETTTTIIAAYCDWRYDETRFETLQEAISNDSVYRLPARVTRRSYIVRYGGDRKAMESGEGNVRKILKRFARRRDDESIGKWRHLIGSHGRLTRALIRFELEKKD